MSIENPSNEEAPDKRPRCFLDICGIAPSPCEAVPTGIIPGIDESLCVS